MPVAAVAQTVRRVCGVASPRALDHIPGAAHAFNEMIRRPYMEHMGMNA